MSDEEIDALTPEQVDAGWALITEFIAAVFGLYGAGAFVETEDGGVKLSPEAEEYIAQHVDHHQNTTEGTA